MKKICVLLIILLIQGNKYISSQEDTPFSFEEFLQQIERDQSNKTKKQEQEIIDILERQIKPLANDLSKIVQGPEAEKALEEKKKQREQKQKEAEKRLDQTRRQRSSSYYPSYRTPSTSGYTPRYRSDRGDYRTSDYGGYKPKSSWDKYWDKYYKDADKDKFATDTKPAERERVPGAYQATEGKDSKKSLTLAKNLTKEINETLTRLIKSPPNIKNLATSNTFALLKEKFDKREDTRSKISEKDETHKKGQLESFKKEKAQWLAFLPQMTKAITYAEKTPDSSEMTAAQSTGKALLNSLQNKGYLTETLVNNAFYQIEKNLSIALKKLNTKYAKKEDTAIKDAIDIILKQADKIPGGPKDPTLRSRAPKAAPKEEKASSKEPVETDASQNRIKTLTRRLKNIIEQATNEINIDATETTDIEKNNQIYKTLVTTENIFTKIRKWFDMREQFVDELENPENFIKTEEDFWLKLMPIFLNAITYTDLNEDPDDENVKAMEEEQKQGKEFLDDLLDIGYIHQKKLDKIRNEFEENLAEQIEQIEEGKPEAAKFKKIRNKLPGGPQTEELQKAKFKT